MLSTNYASANRTYKDDLALNNPQGLIYHKTNLTKPNQELFFFEYLEWFNCVQTY